jgi:radical SAM superfamily enzyme YgiQ (UPF0313 family)
MTYWYPGVFKLIEITKQFFKDVPVVLGGIYAALCHEHAKKCSGADIVFKSGNELEAVKLISKLTQFRLPHSAFRNESYPAFDLYPHLDYVCITTTRGCSFRCTYCASPILSKGFVGRVHSIRFEEVEGEHKERVIK